MIFHLRFIKEKRLDELESQDQVNQQLDVVSFVYINQQPEKLSSKGKILQKNYRKKKKQKFVNKFR